MSEHGTERYGTIVIGASQARLAVGYHLARVAESGRAGRLIHTSLEKGDQ